MAVWAIDKIEIGGGFLSNLSLELPQGLVCIIGPRGSGKSTLAEAIRLAVVGVPKDAHKQRLDFLKANLGSSVLSLSTTPGTDRGGYTIRRTFGQTAILTGGDERSVTEVDLDQGTFLPLDAYTSLDVEAIADESFGVKRRDLLDDICAHEIQNVEIELSEHRRCLEANAESILSVERNIRELSEQQEELGDVSAKLKALPPASEKEGTPEFQAVSEQKRLNEIERKNLTTASDSLKCLADELPRLITQCKSEIPAPLSNSKSANIDLLNAADQNLSVLWAALNQQLVNMTAGISESLDALLRCSTLLKEHHTKQESSYLELQQLNQEAVRALETRNAAERDAAKSNSLSKERKAASVKLKELFDERKQLKGAFVLTRDKVSALRERVATDLQKEAGEKVRIRVQRNADTNTYRHQLTDALYGSRLKNQDEILEVLLTIRPDELAVMLRENDFQEFETHTHFGTERGGKIFNAIESSFDPMKLEVLPIDDRVIIELNVSTQGDANFKDASELSRGQKCTALLPILMARRDGPLLIDQPEDNLDNHFIYETVVESIMRLKHQRQMIFITHNANIPVLGEAELVVVMNSDGKQGFVEKAGTVDECRNEIVNLLEGGREAFEMRRQRYEY